MRRAAASAVCLAALVAGADLGGGTLRDRDGLTGTIYVLRHGEKVPAGNHLNATGLARAQWIGDLFAGGAGAGAASYAPPVAIFANLRDEEYNSVELATPTARRLGLRVDARFHRPAHGDNNTVPAAAMLQALAQTGGPVLTVWEHKNIVALVSDMGCYRPWMEAYRGTAWSDGSNDWDSFDRFFILHFHKGACVSVDLRREGFKSYLTWPSPSPALSPAGLVALFLVLFVSAVLLVANLWALLQRSWWMLNEHIKNNPDSPMSLRLWFTPRGPNEPLLGA